MQPNSQNIKSKIMSSQLPTDLHPG